MKTNKVKVMVHAVDMVIDMVFSNLRHWFLCPSFMGPSTDSTPPVPLSRHLLPHYDLMLHLPFCRPYLALSRHWAHVPSLGCHTPSPPARCRFASILPFPCLPFPFIHSFPCLVLFETTEANNKCKKWESRTRRHFSLPIGWVGFSNWLL